MAYFIIFSIKYQKIQKNANNIDKINVGMH